MMNESDRENHLAEPENFVNDPSTVADDIGYVFKAFYMHLGEFVMGIIGIIILCYLALLPIPETADRTQRDLLSHVAVSLITGAGVSAKTHNRS